MAKKGHVATVQIFVDIDDLFEATTAIGEFLQNAEFEGKIKDWAYLQVGGQLLHPTGKLYMEPYEEGDFLK